VVVVVVVVEGEGEMGGMVEGGVPQGAVMGVGVEVGVGAVEGAEGAEGVGVVDVAAVGAEGEGVAVVEAGITL
jgi:hypothetical protein